MARDHAQIRLDMWGDDDWRLLSPSAQHLYMLLLTSPTLNFCGVVDWRPARIARLANGWTPSAVEKAAGELQDGLFLILDVETEEALIRSFVRHDGLMKSPNMATAMSTDHAAIASPKLRGIVVHELRRLREKHPDLAGWRSTKALAVLERLAFDPRGNPSVNPSGKGSANPSVNPNPNPSVNPSPTPTPTPTPNSSSKNQEQTLLSIEMDEPEPTVDPFDEFWAAYPRKTQKVDARKAYRRAIKKADAETILAGLQRYKFKPDREFQPQAERWLNGERWNDTDEQGGNWDPAELPAPGAGWTDHQLTLVLGVDDWEPGPPPAGQPADRWEFDQRRIHRAHRVQAAIQQIGGQAA